MASRNSDLDPFQGFNAFKPGWKPYLSTDAWTGSQSQKTPGVMQAQAPPVPTQKPAPKNVGVKFPHPDKVTPEVNGVVSTPNQTSTPAQPAAPATAWQWQPGQAPQWPIKPPPQGEMPFEAAKMLQDREQSRQVTDSKPSYIPPNYNTQLQGGFAPTPGSQEYGGYLESAPGSYELEKQQANARDELFKKYHGGWSWGEYKSLKDQGLIGPRIGVQGDPRSQGTEEVLRNKILRDANSIPIYRGNKLDDNRNEALQQLELLNKSRAIGVQSQADLLRSQAAMEEAQGRNPIRQGEWAVNNPGQARALAALEGRKPEDLAAFPPGAGNPIGPGNYSQQLQSYPDLARILTSPDLQLHEKLGLISKVPGADNPNHPIHQIAKSWLAEQMASEDKRNEYAQQYEYPSSRKNLLDRFLNTQLGISQRAARRQQELNQLLNQFGYQFPDSSSQ